MPLQFYRLAGVGGPARLQDVDRSDTGTNAMEWPEDLARSVTRPYGFVDLCTSMTVPTRGNIVLRARLTILGSMLAVLGLMLFPATASAQYAPTGDDFITCTPDPAEPGDEVTCTAGLFDPGSDVEVVVTINGTEVLSETQTADDEGAVGFSFDIPADAEDGVYTVTLTGMEDGEVKVLSDTGEIAEAADDDLADTGAAGTLPLGTIALVALVLGAAILVGTRRRMNATVDA